jgi:hypothetical protein
MGSDEGKAMGSHASHFSSVSLIVIIKTKIKNVRADAMLLLDVLTVYYIHKNCAFFQNVIR